MLNEEQRETVKRVKGILETWTDYDESPEQAVSDIRALVKIISSIESQGSLLERLLREKNEIGFDNGFCRIAYYNSFYYYGNSDGSETVFNTFHELASFLESQLKQTNG